VHARLRASRLPGCASFVGFVLTVAALAPSAAASASTTQLTVVTSTIAAGEVGVAYAQRVQASGGTPPYEWSTSSPLPAGLTFSAAGVLAGTPQSTAVGPLAVAVRDATGAVQGAQLSLQIGSGPTVTTNAIPPPSIGQPYSGQLSASGGAPPYSWSVSSGPLPVGLVLNSTGFLSGLPAVVGTTSTTFTVTDSAGASASATIEVTVAPAALPPETYLVTSGVGGVSAFASPGVQVPQTTSEFPGDVAGIATDSTGSGYWMVSATGHVSASPRTKAFGSVGAKHLSSRIIGIAVKPDGSGYWIASSTGHVYGFGGARSLGSVARRQLSGTIVGIAASPNGRGYWLASSSGHVYAFGTAHTLRERGRVRLNPSIVAIAADPVISGYWLVSRAGRVYAFGHAAVAGSIAAGRHVRSVVGIAAAPDGGGYWIALRNGTVEAFRSASVLRAVEVAPVAGAVAIASAA